jgi:hypothetical protein
MQFHRLAQRDQALRTDFGFVVAVCLPSPQQLAKTGYIQPDVSLGIGADALSIYDQPFPTQGLLEHREIATESRTSTARVCLRPEKGHERLAGVSLSRHRQVGDESQILARVESDWLTLALKQGCT